MGNIDNKLDIEEVNRRYSLLGFRLLEPYKNVTSTYKTACFCNNVFYPLASSVFTKNVRSCGCVRSHIDTDEIRKRFKIYGLELLEEYTVGYIDHRTRCHCNIEFLAKPDWVWAGNVKSCGCLKVRHSNRNPNWKGYEEISASYWNDMIRNCIATKRNFEITIQQAWQLFIKQDRRCAISNIEIGFKPGSHRKRGQTASLDRIDRSIGYILSNVRWVHTSINFMRSTPFEDLSDETLLYWAKLIVENNAGLPQIEII